MNNTTYTFAIDTTDTPIITLFADELSVKIAPQKGSNMFAMTFRGHPIIYSDQNVLKQAGFTGTYVLFPTPNRVQNFTYSWNGKNYTLQKNGTIVDIHHQLVFDQKWSYSQPVVQDDSVSVTTSISIDKNSHLYTGFPFPCTLTLQYTLYSTGITISYRIDNTGSETLPFGFGLHPHFARLSGNDKTLVTIPAKSVMENTADTMIPNGTVLPVTGPTDIRQQTPVGKLNLDHVFTDIIPNRFAVVDYTTLGFKIVLKPTSDFTHIVCWSGHPDAVCIETQTCSTDAHNLYAKGFVKESHLLTVAPGQAHSGSISYEIVRN